MLKMNINLSQDISQEAVKLLFRQRSSSSDESVSSSNYDHPDNKKGKLAFARGPAALEQSNDSVFNNSMSKSQASRYHKDI